MHGLPSSSCTAHTHTRFLYRIHERLCTFITFEVGNIYLIFDKANTLFLNILWNHNLCWTHSFVAYIETIKSILWRIYSLSVCVCVLFEKQKEMKNKANRKHQLLWMATTSIRCVWIMFIWLLSFVSFIFLCLFHSQSACALSHNTNNLFPSYFGCIHHYFSAVFRIEG